jgi:formylglycine-generating enzyme required for sulfatase activity
MTRTTIVRLLLAVAACQLFWCDCGRDHGGPAQRFSVDVTAQGPGSVTVDPTDDEYARDAVVTLDATPTSGALFVRWDGDTQTTVNPLTLVMTRDRSLRAVFALPPTGMVLVPARDSVFVMGSASPLASKANEAPVHPVRFTHDFYMDRTETTQQQYLLTTGIDPVTGRGLLGVGDSFPVFEVTWYEAVLYCNARSKAEGYDTVYTYSAICPSTQTCPYVLENLQIHYERFGYRLPTEAEWEYACRAGTASDFFWGDSSQSTGTFAWYSDNASNSAHPVATKSANSFGLHDMSGNVAEWVNDWLEVYRDSLAVDPVGPTNLTLEEFEQSGERPVRGGSYAVGSSYLRSSARRQGPYEAAARVRLPSIGFRTVMGAFIPHSQPDSDSSDTTAPQVTRTCEKSDLIGFLGTSRVKLAFVQQTPEKRRLYCVDFTSVDLTSFLLVDTMTVSSPNISPEGARIAYSTHGEGYTGASSVALRWLAPQSGEIARTPPGANAFIPRWWVSPSSGDTFLVYTDGATMNSLPEWRREKTYRQRISGLGFSASAEVLRGIGSYHGGLSHEGRFLATGYTDTRVFDFVTQDTSTIYMCCPPYNGRDDSLPQTCNVSISPSITRTDEVLLLDFGYSKKSSVVGYSYGVHQIIYRCNSKVVDNGHIVAWYPAPAGYTELNDVEYTNHPDYAVAVARHPNADSGNTVFLIDLATSRYLPILSGAGVRDPALWIDPAEKSEAPDPYYDFARYDVPMLATTQTVWTKKLKLMWTRRESIQMPFLGSSVAEWGFDPSVVTRVSAFNLGVIAGDLATSATVALNYALSAMPNVKVIGMSLDVGTIARNTNQAPPMINGLWGTKGYDFDKAHDFWRGGLPAPIQAKVDAYAPSTWSGYDTTGTSLTPRAGAWGTLCHDGGDYVLQDSIPQYTLSLVKMLADSAARRGIHVLVVYLPESPGYLTDAMVGRLGPSHATYRQVRDWLRALEASNAYFHYYDAHNEGDHDYTDADAMDCQHLSNIGALKMSARIDSVLGTFLP